MPIDVQIDNIGPFSANSMQWGPQHAGSSPDATPTQAQISDIILTKDSDQYSQTLMQACVMGTSFTAATITLSRVDDSTGNRVPYLVLQLSSVMIPKFATSTAGDTPTDSLDLNFSSVTYSYP